MYKARFEQGLAGFEHKDQVEVVFRCFELDPQRAKGDTVQVLPMLASKYGMSLEQAKQPKQAEGRVAENAADAGLEYLTEGRDHGNRHPDQKAPLRHTRTHASRRSTLL